MDRTRHTAAVFQFCQASRFRLLYKTSIKSCKTILAIRPLLKKWADQGVLLLNSVLTVRAGQAFSHRGHGWEQLTDAAIHALSERPRPVVFILWGKAAQSKIPLINTQTNIVLQSPHPSPFSANRGFFGSKPFSKTNEALVAMGETPIDWRLPEHVDIDAQWK